MRPGPPNTTRPSPALRANSTWRLLPLARTQPSRRRGTSRGLRLIVPLVPTMSSASWIAVSRVGTGKPAATAAIRLTGFGSHTMTCAPRVASAPEVADPTVPYPSTVVTTPRSGRSRARTMRSTEKAIDSPTSTSSGSFNGLLATEYAATGSGSAAAYRRWPASVSSTTPKSRPGICLVHALRTEAKYPPISQRTSGSSLCCNVFKSSLSNHSAGGGQDIWRGGRRTAIPSCSTCSGTAGHSEYGIGITHSTAPSWPSARSSAGRSGRRCVITPSRQAVFGRKWSITSEKN